jgi:hypothetical protein
MKKQYFFVSLLNFFFALSSFSQEKHDYTWMMGTSIISAAHRSGGTIIDFNSGKPDTFSLDLLFNLDQTTTTMSDRYGQLQYYSNGCEIINWNHERMTNGDSINYPSRNFDKNCSRRMSYGTHSGILSLPMPGTDDQYAMFHLRYDSSTAPFYVSFYNPQSLLYTVIDMSAENGLGRVMEKNVLALKDTFCDMLSAVRHGNGRDWWLAALKPGSGDIPSDKILLFLLTPYGVEGPFVKKTGLTWAGNPSLGARGQAVFSPDGTRYARFDNRNGIQLYCFDRCTGEFSCPVALPFSDDEVDAAGVSFSPNNRFLYASTGQKMYQFDCAAEDIQSTKTLLGVYDGFKAPLWTTFYQQRIAPDGKIYMNCTNGAYYLHVVHNPDAKGKDCNFEQHGFELPTQNGFGLPNFPNYRLYDWAGSPCDTVGVDAPTDTVRYFDESLRLFPNPANRYVTVVPPECVWGNLRAYNVAGQLMGETLIITSGETYTLDVEHWPTGVYFLVADTRERGVETKRLMVQH